MKSRAIEKSNWLPVSYYHQFDDMVKYSSKKANTVDGMSLNIPKFHDIAKNINTTETSNFCLTDVTKLNDLLKIEIPISQYPEQFTTSLLCNSYPTITNSSCYLYVIEETVSKRSAMSGLLPIWQIGNRRNWYLRWSAWRRC